MTDAAPALTERFLAAVALAQEVHGRQRRTGTEIPYMAHLLVVCGLVLEDGGDEDEAIAALLHDAVEDGGGRPLLERIRRSFGPRVALLVQGLTDNLDGDARSTWVERKRRYLAHLPAVSDEGVLRIALADKIHNARSLVRDYRRQGCGLWARFGHRTARDQLWYYGGLLKLFQRRRPGPLTEDLAGAVGELAWLIARDDARRAERVRLWLDPDLHGAQAPDGWVHVLTASHATSLLAEHRVSELSIGDAHEGRAVADWLMRVAGEDPARWPGRILLHGEADGEAIAALSEALDHAPPLRRVGAREWVGATTGAAWPARAHPSSATGHN